MTSVQIQELVSAGAYNQPLPRQVEEKRLILSVTLSTCCDADALLVVSRDGGFVSRDCLKCGKSSYLKKDEIPDLDCESCRNFKRTGTVEPVLKERNYWYRCTGCRREWGLAAILPHWSEGFGYCGLAAPGDPGWVPL